MSDGLTRSAEDDWAARAAATAARVDAVHRTAPTPRPAGDAHPVWDFLFTYYSLRPRQLRVLASGLRTALAGPAAAEYLDRAGYVAVPPASPSAAEYLSLRGSTPSASSPACCAPPPSGRPSSAASACTSGRWSTAPTHVRHNRVPLRLGAAGTDAVVESMPLRCSHFDAFRFSRAAAAPRNHGTPTRDSQADWEQPGCLHANMDLYKWSYKLGPLAGSELLLDCLDLAADARELDMRASPYDLSGLRLQPIAIEEPAGRAEYVRRQSVVAERAAPLRAALLERCEQLLNAAAGQEATLLAGKMY